ncbi:unnamed protein product [Polarella glacialis]|uniref:SH3 domain-containing protein n=1 Tax=Polarella glacialis TaxID=89957 RepID=A0A813LIT1_POLGL|nr:unnamed protein product [Polarella glacialis]
MKSRSSQNRYSGCRSWVFVLGSLLAVLRHVGDATGFAAWRCAPHERAIRIQRQAAKRTRITTTDAFSDTAESEKWYKAMTKINIRMGPDSKSPTLADAESSRLKNGEIVSCLDEGQVFEVEESRAVDGQTYLKLASQDGWVFTRGVAGKWADRNIVELIKDVDVANEKGKDFANSLGRKMVRDPSDLVAWYALGGVVLFLVFFKLYETID